MDDLYGDSRLTHSNRLQLQPHALLGWYGLAATHPLEPFELVKDPIDSPLERRFVPYKAIKDRNIKALGIINALWLNSA